MSEETIEYLKLLHGSFNSGVVMLFLYQGFLGLKIRRSARSDYARKHRRIGPVAALLGISGFIAGMIIIYIDTGRIFKYPLHFFTGILIASLIFTTYRISQKIKGPEKYWRDRHYAIGIPILLLYILQVFLGLGILL